MLRRFLPLLGALVAAGAVASPGFAAERSPAPVPSLTPAKTARLWEQLASRPRALSLSRQAVCAAPVRAVFYSPTDWLRLATKLAANPAPCAEYYISVPALAADKTQFRTDQAWRIRALGPQFHALAEVNVSGWSGWVSTNGGNWEAAGQEARRRLAAAGYDVGAGDTWVVNELSSAVRQGVGNARTNMRSFVRGLYEGDGTVARGVVFVVGMSQATTELSVYQSRLQDWYEDAPFWEDMSRYVSDWSQELYGDVRNWAVAGADPGTRATVLNEYLQHEVALARVAPASGTAAASFLSSAYSPLGNAAWAWDSAFGWTDVAPDLMQSYVSSQTAAMRSYGGSRLGFAWSPKNLHAVATADFNAQTDALLDRLAAAIAGSDPCAPSWCGGDLEGAAFNPGWRTFSAWKPSRLAFATAPQAIAPGAASSALTVQLQTNTGVAYTAGLPVPITFESSSPGGSFSTSTTGPWTSRLTVEITSGSSSASVFYRDAQSGSPTISASAPGKHAATQVATVADVTAPTVSITAPAEGARVSGTVTLEASAADNLGVARVELLVNDVVLATLSAPPFATAWASGSVPDGAVTLTARAFDNAGNVGTATRAITVDNTAPQATITSGPTSSTSDTAASFAFSSSESDVAFQCSLDARPFAACVSPQTYTGLAAGEHVFQVRAADSAGNVQQQPAERRWTVVLADTGAPETTIDSGPSGTVTSTSASFAFSASEANTTFACRLDTGLWSNCSSPRAYTGLTGGQHTFEVRATDASGNTDLTPAARTWTIQTATSGSNDAFVGAQAISGPSGTVTGSNSGATKESGEPAHNGNAGGKSIWYRWVAPSTGTATIDTIGSSFDTLLAVYTGGSVGALTKVASDDDSGGSYTSKVSFNAVAGTTYQVAVDGYSGASGTVKLTWALSAGAAGPANDLFVNAQALTGGSGAITGGNAGASKEAGEPAHNGNAGGKSIWYRWTAPSTGTATIDTIGSSFDTVLAVYTGSAVSGLTRVASDDDSGGNRASRLAFRATAGTTYRIAVDGYNGATGSVKLNWVR